MSLFGSSSTWLEQFCEHTNFFCFVFCFCLFFVCSFFPVWNTCTNHFDWKLSEVWQSTHNHLFTITWEPYHKKNVQLHFWSDVFWLIVNSGGEGLFDVVMSGRQPPLLDLQAHPWPKVLAALLMPVRKSERGRRSMNTLSRHKVTNGFNSSEECQLSRLVQDICTYKVVGFSGNRDLELSKT